MGGEPDAPALDEDERVPEEAAARMQADEAVTEPEAAEPVTGPEHADAQRRGRRLISRKPKTLSFKTQSEA